MPVPGGCPECGKIRYVTRKQAKLAASRVTPRFRVYTCGDFWHWTRHQPWGRVAFYRDRASRRAA